MDLAPAETYELWAVNGVYVSSLILVISAHIYVYRTNFN